MSSKLKKIIWIILMIELYLLHFYLLAHFRYELYYLSHRASVRLGLPLVFNDSGYLLTHLFFLLCALLFILYHLIQYRNFRKHCIESCYPVTDQEVTDAFARAARCAGLTEKHLHSLYYSDIIASPLVMGVHPAFLLFPKRLEHEKHRHLIFLHECHHLRQWDTAYKMFMLMMNCLLWYQPLAWLIRLLSWQDIEVACDEAVVQGQDEEERYAYGSFLLECLRLEHSGQYRYSTFFYSQKQLMKARINAIMSKKQRRNLLGAAAILLLLLQTGAFAMQMTQTAIVTYKASKAPVNKYDGYEAPAFNTPAVLKQMTALPPVSPDAFYEEFNTNAYEKDIEYADLSYTPEGPWQVRLKNTRHYEDAATLLFTSYLYYYDDQLRGSTWNNEYGEAPRTETIYQRLLAGDRTEAVFALILKEYITGYETHPLYQNGTAQISCEDGSYYAYYPVAVHIRLVKDHIYELAGVSSLELTRNAFQASYQDTSLEDIPVLNLKYALEKGTASRQTSTSEGVLNIKAPDSDLWEEVPVPLETLFDRGDQMDGTLTKLQPGSYQCDDKKVLFAYGGGYSYDDTGEVLTTPVSVTFFDTDEGGWRTAKVTDRYAGVRRLFVSFPEDGQTGYLLLTCDRVVWQEQSICFATADGGKTWRELGVAGASEGSVTHSLTNDFGFVTKDIGFLSIHSSYPAPLDLWRTADGGRSFAPITLPDLPEYYNTAFMPEYEVGILTLYVGMEEYGAYNGLKAVCTSTDGGVTWNYEHMAIRR